MSHQCIIIMVDHEVLDRLFETARSAIGAKRALSFTMTMASTALPANTKGWLLLDDLDVSEDQSYPIIEFELGPTILRLKDEAVRPRSPRREPYRSSEESASFNVRFDEVQTEIRSDQLQFTGQQYPAR
jgi:hypothetical protein